MRLAAAVAPMLALVLLPASAAAIAGRAVGDGGPTCASPHDAVCLDCAAVGAPSCCDQGGCFAVQPYSGAGLAQACRRPGCTSAAASMSIRLGGGGDE